MRYLKELLTPVSLLKGLLLTIAVALAAIAVVVALLMHNLSSQSREASANALSAQMAAESEVQLANLKVVLERRVNEFLDSPQVRSLPPEQQAALSEELHRRDTGAPAPGTDRPLVPLSMTDTVTVQQAAEFISNGYTSFADAAVQATGTAGKQALARYYADPTPGNLRLLLVQLDALLSQLDARVLTLQAQAQAGEAQFSDSTVASTVGILVAISVVGIVILLLGHRTTTMVHDALEAGRREQLELGVATARLQFRNDQLNALYNVFTEITDTLSLEYVVDATLRESMSIMRADMATLRVLRGDELVAIGAMISTGQEIRNLIPVQLGIGPTGRTAKRGRTLRIDEGGERMMGGAAGTQPGQSPSEQTNRSPMESGLIVPLVVGARVVGTLACWSRNVNAFNDEDQRVLEMMASQVATAIAAAEATESSERRAHQDALTSLPNRRQLDEDLNGRLATLATEGRDAVVAMVDIDYFKRLNDEYGHQVGDIALQRIASVLRSSVRDNDYVYRFGGEEFVLILGDTSVSEALPLAERLRSTVSSVQITSQNGEVVGPVTVSIGLALLPQHGRDVRLLIDLADKAMYQAKSSGRNRVVVWSEDVAEAQQSEAA